MKDQLIERHGFDLWSDDLKSIDRCTVRRPNGGPDPNYSFLSGGRGGWGWFPTYAQLMTETDGQGVQRSYLATEENFRILRKLENNNAIVPVVGDFAGPKAIRSVGGYLRDHRATVTAFYTSNVSVIPVSAGRRLEEVLFQCRHAPHRWKQHVHTVNFKPGIPGPGLGRRLAGDAATLLDCRSAEGVRRRQNVEVFRRHRDVEMRPGPT